MAKVPLRQIFTPIQPFTTQKVIDYQQFIPHVQLQDSIYCYWQLKTNFPLSTTFNYQVVADGCMDIFFDINQPTDSFVMGFSSQSTQFRLPDSFHYIGVRFLPTAFPRLFRIDAHELTDRDEFLDDVLKSTAQFICRNFYPTMPTEVIVQQLDQYFGTIHSQLKDTLDPRLASALYLIIQNKGAQSIEQGLDVGISIRQLRRLFKQYVGHSPKTFAKIVRFQHLLKLNNNSHLYNSKLFYDLGYHDQAHFIKEFKTLFGSTPTEAFSK